MLSADAGMVVVGEAENGREAVALAERTRPDVAILDVDAHFGNGVAHCVRDEPRIRYCSIHEETQEQVTTELDPQGAQDEDTGPRNNLRNVNLKSGTGWETGYQAALVDQAIPFLLHGNDGDGPPPDLLLVAVGFDALRSDWSSNLNLVPEDYAALGEELRRTFGDRIACGLEGGYSCDANEGIGPALRCFVRPWQQTTTGSKDAAMIDNVAERII